MNAPRPSSGSSPSPDAIARTIRECKAIVTVELEIIHLCAAHAPGCEEAVQRIRQQLRELERLADELDGAPLSGGS